MNQAAPLRLGVLGTAWITPSAIIRPAKKLGNVEVAAVAARDPDRAGRFAKKHDIPKVHATYSDLIGDPTIEAVYVPLPNSLHAEWSIRALEAGKHVLCEKPIASNAAEAEAMSAAAARAGKILAEAMHYRYHPLADRVRRILAGGELGPVRQVEVRSCFPIFRKSDIRYQYSLGGGAMMDLGCYAVDCARFVVGAEPDVIRAEAKLASEKIDRWMSAELAFPNGASGRVLCSMWSMDILKGDVLITSDNAELKIDNIFAPHLFHAIKWRTPSGKRTEKLGKTESTSYYQLQAFYRAVREGVPMPTDSHAAIANMRVIDAIYQKAGLPIRGLK